MGVQNNAILFFGFKYNFNEVKHLIESPDAEIIDILLNTIDNTIDINDEKSLKSVFMNVWEELYYYNVETASVCFYFDAPAEDHTFLLGIRLKNEITIDKINELNDQEIKLNIIKFCEKYNFPKKEFKIMSFADVS